MTWRKEHFTKSSQCLEIGLNSLFSPSVHLSSMLLYSIELGFLSVLIDRPITFISRVTAQKNGIDTMQINNQVDNEDISSLGFIGMIAQNWFPVSTCCLYIFSSMHGESMCAYACVRYRQDDCDEKKKLKEREKVREKDEAIVRLCKVSGSVFLNCCSAHDCNVANPFPCSTADSLSSPFCIHAVILRDQCPRHRC